MDMELIQLAESQRKAQARANCAEARVIGVKRICCLQFYSTVERLCMAHAALFFTIKE